MSKKFVCLDCGAVCSAQRCISCARKYRAFGFRVLNSDLGLLYGSVEERREYFVLKYEKKVGTTKVY